MGVQIKLQQWRYFVAVAETLNFRLAAQQLFITQPPLTRQIQALEAALGLTLFERNRQGVRLTDAGQTVLEQARSLLQAAQALQTLEALPRPVSDAGAAAGPPRLRLGLTSVVDAGGLADLQAAFQKRWPGCEVQMVRDRSTSLVRRVSRGELEAALIGLPARTEGLELTPLWADPLMACLPATHPLARQRTVALTALQDRPLFWFKRSLNPSFYDYCEQVFNRLGYQPPRLPEPAEHHVLLAQVAAGQGVALVPRSMRALRRQGVVYRVLRDAGGLSVQIGLVWRARKAGPPAEAAAGPGLPDMAALAQCAREAMGGRSPGAETGTPQTASATGRLDGPGQSRPPVANGPDRNHRTRPGRET
ncbi:LysR family transcriptional regulator [Azohydromonas australica]|uniref:LysR family transcriptional regulator n=1 Tax=Azohydromonas australica TaxID=364039 RepID=UPI00068738CC|nr:LysR family transcriptional regulator [Azohydromonas australica]